MLLANICRGKMFAHTACEAFEARCISVHSGPSTWKGEVCGALVPLPAQER